MGLYQTIRETAYDILAQKRKDTLRGRGVKVLHDDEGRMSAREIAIEINNNPSYAWSYPPVTTDQVRAALMTVVMNDKRFAWIRSFDPVRLKFWTYCDE